MGIKISQKRKKQQHKTPTTNPFSKNYPMNNDKINGILNDIHLQNGISSNYNHSSVPIISNNMLDTKGPYQWSSPEIDDLFVSDPNVNISSEKPIKIEENIIALIEVNDIKNKCNKEIDDVYAKYDIPFNNYNNLITPTKNIITPFNRSKSINKSSSNKSSINKSSSNKSSINKSSSNKSRSRSRSSNKSRNRIKKTK
jgi:hypothetical protein